MNPLILHLRQKYYWMIKRGEKTTEYRECKPYWTSRITDAKEIIFVLGYYSSDDWNLKADILKIDICNFNSLPDYVKKEFEKSKYKAFYKIDFKLKEVWKNESKRRYL